MDWGTVILAIVGVLTLVAAVIAWFYKRGGSDREMQLTLKTHTVALNANTIATDKLTDRLEGITETLHEHDLKLREHDILLRQYPNGNSPADRDAGSRSRRQAG